MRDYMLIIDDQKNVKVSDLSTKEIWELIKSGVDVMEENITEENVMDRLHLELFILR